MNLENTFYELFDPLRQNASYTLAGKVDEHPFIEVQAKSYDPITHTARVAPLAAGEGQPIEVRAQVHYTGATPGTGEAFAIVPEERYKVAFIDGYRTGIYSCGEITGTTFSYTSKHPPAYAPFQQQGVGRVVVDPRKPSGHFKALPGQATVLLGNARYVNDNSEVAETRVGPTEVEDLNNQTDTVHGTNMTYPEEMLREAMIGMKNAAKILMA